MGNWLLCFCVVEVPKKNREFSTNMDDSYKQLFCTCFNVDIVNFTFQSLDSYQLSTMFVESIFLEAVYYLQFSFTDDYLFDMRY